MGGSHIGNKTADIIFFEVVPLDHKMNTENSIGDAHIPETGEIVFNTMRYRSSETVQETMPYSFRDIT